MRVKIESSWWSVIGVCSEQCSLLPFWLVMNGDRERLRPIRRPISSVKKWSSYNCLNKLKLCNFSYIISNSTWIIERTLNQSKLVLLVTSYKPFDNIGNAGITCSEDNLATKQGKNFRCQQTFTSKAARNRPYTLKISQHLDIIHICRNFWIQDRRLTYIGTNQQGKLNVNERHKFRKVSRTTLRLGNMK